MSTPVHSLTVTVAGEDGSTVTVVYNGFDRMLTDAEQEAIGNDVIDQHQAFFGAPIKGSPVFTSGMKFE